MEQCSFFQLFLRNIRCLKMTVCPRIMQKDTVNPRNCKHDRIRGLFPLFDQHIRIRIMFFQNIQDHIAKSIFSDLSHQRYISTKLLHGKTRVGNTATRMYVSRANLQKLSGGQDFPRMLYFSVRKHRCDIKADMSRRDYLLFFHTYSIPISKFITYISSASKSLFSTHFFWNS